MTTINAESASQMDDASVAASATPIDVPRTAPPSRFPIAAYIPPGRLSRWYDKLEAFISKLSVRDTFWQRICSLIWLPYAFFSGIRMKSLDAETYAAVLPFRRFNRNWYRAMAGGALLANTEIAGGMYVFGICGADYTVVCKHLDYTFLRPCFGNALYKMKPRENIHQLLAGKGEFNLTLDVEVVQLVSDQRDKRVGKAEVIFHVTPKLQHKVKKQRKLLARK